MYKLDLFTDLFFLEGYFADSLHQYSYLFLLMVFE